MGSKTTSVRVHGTELRCVVCKHDEFERRRWIMADWLAMLTHWLGSQEHATCYVCVRCGYVHGFVPVPGQDVKAS